MINQLINKIVKVYTKEMIEEEVKDGLDFLSCYENRHRHYESCIISDDKSLNCVNLLITRDGESSKDFRIELLKYDECDLSAAKVIYVRVLHGVDNKKIEAMAFNLWFELTYNLNK